VHLVGFYYKNISRCTVLWMSNSCPVQSLCCLGKLVSYEVRKYTVAKCEVCNVTACVTSSSLGLEWLIIMNVLNTKIFQCVGEKAFLTTSNMVAEPTTQPGSTKTFHWTQTFIMYFHFHIHTKMCFKGVFKWTYVSRFSLNILCAFLILCFLYISHGPIIAIFKHRVSLLLPEFYHKL
jgi:hypothetical protein